jgi:nitrate reductase cytochrome c-type subunit
MKQLQIMMLAAVLAASGLQADEIQNEDLDARAAASREAVKTFAQNLQGELQTAMKASGPIAAIAVCSEKAPAIAAAVSEAQGWSVGRTSLKPRNPDNAPDDWERSVLTSFDQRRAAGEDPAKLEFIEIVGDNGNREFRYMKAIGIAKDAPCLACHGTNIAPEVGAKLKALYPDDQATGYKTGDIRGAFTIRQPM